MYNYDWCTKALIVSVQWHNFKGLNIFNYNNLAASQNTVIEVKVKKKEKRNK